jgi:regulator of cell morphogenesis and NO signaling
MEEQITIGETVKKDFRAAQVFTRHGIDFCCGGKKTISDACREKKVNENELRAELAKITSGSDTVAELINSMDADALANYIVKKHHSYVTDTIPVIMQYLDKVYKVHGHGYPELEKVYANFSAVADELTHHMMKEERVLFPYISALAVAKRNNTKVDPPMFGTVANPIHMMEAEHENAGNLLREINEITNGYTIPPEACNTFRVSYLSLNEFEQDLHMHVHLENNILFPLAKKLEQELIG